MQDQSASCLKVLLPRGGLSWAVAGQLPFLPSFFPKSRLQLHYGVNFPAKRFQLLAVLAGHNGQGL